MAGAYRTGSASAIITTNSGANLTSGAHRSGTAWNRRGRVLLDRSGDPRSRPSSELKVSHLPRRIVAP
jgi:hypothetical protein